MFSNFLDFLNIFSLILSVFSATHCLSIVLSVVIILPPLNPLFINFNFIIIDNAINYDLNVIQLIWIIQILYAFRTVLLALITIKNIYTKGAQRFTRWTLTPLEPDYLINIYLQTITLNWIGWNQISYQFLKLKIRRHFIIHYFVINVCVPKTLQLFSLNFLVVFSCHYS